MFDFFLIVKEMETHRMSCVYSFNVLYFIHFLFLYLQKRWIKICNRSSLQRQIKAMVNLGRNGRQRFSSSTLSFHTGRTTSKKKTLNESKSSWMKILLCSFYIFLSLAHVLTFWLSLSISPIQYVCLSFFVCVSHSIWSGLV